VERLAGETEVLGGNLHQRLFVHRKSHMSWPGLEHRVGLYLTKFRGLEKQTWIRSTINQMSEQNTITTLPSNEDPHKNDVLWFKILSFWNDGFWDVYPVEKTYGGGRCHQNFGTYL
jgi:hypothetical protein